MVTKAEANSGMLMGWMGDFKALKRLCCWAVLLGELALLSEELDKHVWGRLTLDGSPQKLQM